MRFVYTTLLVACVSVSGAAQAGGNAQPGPVLALEEAISLARRNNPTHLQTRSARDRSGAALRSAYGALIPSVSSSLSGSYREGRTQLVQGVSFGSTSDVVSTDVGLSVSASYSMSSLLAPRLQRAQLDAAEADIASSDATLRSDVTTQYLGVLQAQARAVLQDTLLANVQAQLELARAREAVGAATTLDVRRAEVQVGQQQVNVLRERNGIEIEKLRLFQLLGVSQPSGVRLTTEFPVAEPTVRMEELLGMAQRSNPTLEALRSRERSSDVTVRQARSQYLPALRFSTGLSGFTSQERDINGSIVRERFGTDRSRESCFSQDSIRVASGLSSIAGECQGIVFTSADEQRIRAANSKYPFDFTRDPLNFSVSLSLPIFDGFTREQRIQEAAVSRNDARYRVRDQELRLVAEVTAAQLNLTTAYRTVRLQEQNSQAAREALALAQERFRVGANTLVEITQARSDYERAETDRINAIYEFHKTWASLERAVGRPLR